MRNDRIDLKEAAEPSGLFSAARRRSIRSRHELGLTQSCEVRRLIVQIQRKIKAKTKRFILAYRLINFATPSVAFDLHVNLKYNYSKWRRFSTSSARPKILMALRLWNPRDRYPIVPMEPKPAEIRVAFSFVERNNVKVAEKLRIHAALLPLCLEIISFSAFPPLHPHNVSSAKALTACRTIQAARVGRFAQQY